MKKSKILAVLGGLLLAAAGAARAATHEIDAAHSSVEFKVRHLVGRVTGTFRAFSGTVEFDEANEAASSVRSEVDVASIDTRVADRDKHLRTADFFDTEKFPKAVLVTKRVDAASKKIIADLTFHGVTREVEFDYVYNGTATDSRGNLRIGGSAKAVINRQDFGIAYDPTGITIGNDVELEFQIEAILKK